MNNFAAKVQRIVYLVVLLFCILIPYSRAGISVTSPDFKRNSVQDNEYPLDITLGDIYLIPEKEYAVSNNEHDVYRLVAEVCIHNKSKKTIVIAWEHTIRGDGASGITITPEGAIKSLEPKHYPLGGNCSNHQKKLKKNIPPVQPSTVSCIILRKIPNAYPTSKNTSKNKLLPLAVFEISDLRIDIGHESPKQSIVNASINSVI